MSFIYSFFARVMVGLASPPLEAVSFSKLLELYLSLLCFSTFHLKFSMNFVLPFIISVNHTLLKSRIQYRIESDWVESDWVESPGLKRPQQVSKGSKPTPHNMHTAYY